MMKKYLFERRFASGPVGSVSIAESYAENPDVAATIFITL
jgi:hypothetical protein